MVTGKHATEKGHAFIDFMSLNRKPKLSGLDAVVHTEAAAVCLFTIITILSVRFIAVGRQRRVLCMAPAAAAAAGGIPATFHVNPSQHNFHDSETTF